MAPAPLKRMKDQTKWTKRGKPTNNEGRYRFQPTLRIKRGQNRGRVRKRAIEDDTARKEARKALKSAKRPKSHRGVKKDGGHLNFGNKGRKNIWENIKRHQRLGEEVRIYEEEEKGSKRRQKKKKVDAKTRKGTRSKKKKGRVR